MPLSISGMLEQIGRSVAGVGNTVVGLIDMLGAVLSATGRVLIRPRGFRLTSTVHHMEQVCWRAVPIVVLITFLIGCIISQQGIFHFPQVRREYLRRRHARRAGFARDRSVAGRDHGRGPLGQRLYRRARLDEDARGDRLRTMGFDPIEVLILPRMLALVLALPILAFSARWPRFMAVGWWPGSMAASIPKRFYFACAMLASIDHFIVGMVKAPVMMAAVIGIVACVEGLAVQGGAESLGQHDLLGGEGNLLRHRHGRRV